MYNSSFIVLLKYTNNYYKLVHLDKYIFVSVSHSVFLKFKYVKGTTAAYSFCHRF